VAADWALKTLGLALGLFILALGWHQVALNSLDERIRKLEEAKKDHEFALHQLLNFKATTEFAAACVKEHGTFGGLQVCSTPTGDQRLTLPYPTVMP
jgi:hypothetical protein